MGEGLAASAGSVAAGLLFGIGWLAWIDGIVTASVEHGTSVSGAWWIPGLFQTVALVMVNLVDWSLLSEDSFGDDAVAARVKCLVFVAFLLAFCGLIGATWILIAEASSPEAAETSWSDRGSAGAALAGVTQNCCIFFGSLLFRCVRRSDDED